MTFTEAVKRGLRNYANFRGVATRPEYWWFALFDVAGSVVFAVARLDPLGTLWSLALVVPLLACAVRRHHDAGRSGWWVLTSIVPLWGLILLLYPTKTLANRYASNATPLDPPAPYRVCPTCAKLPLAGQRYCTNCGTPLDEVTPDA